MHLDTDAYLDWFVTSIVRGWVGELQLREQLRRQLLQIWKERTQSPQWLDAYAESCPVAGAAQSGLIQTSHLRSVYPLSSTSLDPINPQEIRQ